MSVRVEREAVFINDKVKGRRGIYVGLERVPPSQIDNPDITEAYQVQFIPHKKARSAIGAYLVNLLPIANKALVRTTDTVYPAEAIEGPRMVPTHGDGVPEKEIILHEDQHGNAPYADSTREAYDPETGKLAQLQGRLERTSAESAMKDLEHLEDEQQQNRRKPRRDQRKEPSPEDNDEDGDLLGGL